MRTPAGFLLVVSLGLSACCSKTTLTRRFASWEADPEPPFPLVDLGVVATDPPKPGRPGPAVLQLSDHGQAEYVRGLAAGGPKGLLDEIAKPFPSGGSPGPADRSVVKVRLVLSHLLTEAPEIREGDPITEADRITSLETVLGAGGGFRFAGWNRFETVYGDLDLGEVTSGQKRTFNAKLAPTFSGTLVGVGEVGGGVESTVGEKLALKERVVRISGFLTDDSGQILQQGGVGLSLEGNVTVDLVLELDSKPVSFVELGELFDRRGNPKLGEDIDPRVFVVRVPEYEEGKTISIDVVTDYRFRHVGAGSATVIEGDDEVTAYRGETVVGTAVVFDAPAFREHCTVYRAGKSPAAGDPAGSGELRLVRGKQRLELVFDTKAKVDEFQRWLGLQDLPVRLGQGESAWTLSLGPDALRQEDVIDAATQKVDFGLIQALERVE